MMDNIHDICKAVKEEKVLTDEIIERLIDQEKKVYYWNIGRILSEYNINKQEWEVLVLGLSKIDCSLNNVETLKNLKQFYFAHPDIYDFYIKDKNMN